MKRALLYVRVSSKVQEKVGHSLDAQERLGKEYATRAGLTIDRTWRVSESAWKKDRYSFNQMIDYSKKHPEIEHIIFDVTDRMTRNDFDKMKIVDLVKIHNKTIHFSRTNKILDNDFNSDDEFLLDIDVAVAKKWSNTISEKVHTSLQEKAKQGKFPSSPPIGYIKNKQTLRIDIDPDRAPFIEMAFTEMASGNYSLNTLSEKLYSDGLRSKNGSKVIKPTLGKILRNPFYYGSFLWKEKLYSGNHDKVVSKHLFDKVQNVLSGNGHAFHVNKNNFAFNNLLKCSKCGCKVLGEMQKGKYIYYHCTFSKGRHKGKNNYMREDRMAILFEDSVRRITMSHDKVSWAKKALAKSKNSHAKAQAQMVTAQLALKSKLQNRLDRLFDKMMDDTISKTTYKQKKDDYDTQIAGIELAIERSQRINPNFYENGCKILELSNRLYPMYLKSDTDEKGRILRMIASNYVLDELSISAAYAKPFSFMENMGERIIKRALWDAFGTFVLV